jgi:hypothetical protein
MPKFDAGSVVEPLDYDFTTVKGYPHRKAKGVIPEPTDEKIAAFIGHLRDSMTSAKSLAGDGSGAVEDFTDPTAFLGQLDSYDPDKFLSVYSGVASAYSELCSGTPSPEEISALPLRVRLRFFAWVMQEVVSPEAGTGAGTAAVIPLRSSAAG